MEHCDCCGGQLGMAPLTIEYRGRRSTFCSFGCAITQAAPACATCGVKVLGLGLRDQERIYCSARCAMRVAS